jgi:antitoxin (DNA-binding transcriptional repressor) of toxin-antitoxin stability system
MVEQVSKSEFKAKALELFRRIEATGMPVVITDQGHPRFEIRALPNPSTGEESAEEVFAPLRGIILNYDAPFEPVGLDDWEALK